MTDDHKSDLMQLCNANLVNDNVFASKQNGSVVLHLHVNISNLSRASLMLIKMRPPTNEVLPNLNASRKLFFNTHCFINRVKIQVQTK